MFPCAAIRVKIEAVLRPADSERDAQLRKQK